MLRAVLNRYNVDMTSVCKREIKNPRWSRQSEEIVKKPRRAGLDSGITTDWDSDLDTDDYGSGHYNGETEEGKQSTSDPENGSDTGRN